ncbi:hypothetical protein [Ferriphaselus sp. R-1]|uniref:hypothetical protein n=1 Tax=Ferriphaselus sp. R-1 TaxID=1485544 RepID=UPI0005585DA4|nr:hypothetical protein [Ferriphaselus sp. R-1]
MTARALIPFDIMSGEQTLLLQKLLSKQVRFIVVGGYAVRYHGYLRATEDLDLVIEQTTENISRLREALAPDSPEGEWGQLLLPEKKLRWWDVEIFSAMRGLDYRDMDRSAEFFAFFDSSIRVISVSHLKAAKKLAIEATDRDEKKRSQDKDDLEYLEELRNA